MADSEYEVRFAPGVIQGWLEIESREAREEAHQMVEDLRLEGATARTFSLLEGPEHRAYGRLVKILFHRDDARRRISVTHILPR